MAHQTPPSDLLVDHDVREETAPPDIKAVFNDIAQVLRVPVVGLFWRVLAATPELLHTCWQAVRDNLTTLELERAATDLARRAFIEEAAGMSSHKAFKGDLVRVEIDFDLRSRIGNYNQIAYYALAKHLLAVSMLDLSVRGESPTGTNATPEHLPYGIAEGAVAVSPVDPATARGKAAEILPVIAAGHGHPTTEDYFRSLARLPDYLAAGWNAIKPVVRDEYYDERGRELVARATDMARTAPLPIPLDTAALSPEQRQNLQALIDLFRLSLLPDTLMDCALMVALTDGPDAGGRSRYSLV